MRSQQAGTEYAESQAASESKGVKQHEERHCASRSGTLSYFLTSSLACSINFAPLGLSARMPEPATHLRTNMIISSSNVRCDVSDCESSSAVCESAAVSFCKWVIVFSCVLITSA